MHGDLRQKFESDQIIRWRNLHQWGMEYGKWDITSIIWANPPRKKAVRSGCPHCAAVCSHPFCSHVVLLSLLVNLAFKTTHRLFKPVRF